MKKHVTVYYSDSRHSESEFTKAEDVCCPFCRKEELWCDHDMTVLQTNEFRTSFASYLCANCGLLFSLTVSDPDLLNDYNRKTLKNFRTAPIEEG